MDYQKNYTYQNPYTVGQATTLQNQGTINPTEQQFIAAQQQGAFSPNAATQQQCVTPLQQGAFGATQPYNPAIYNPITQVFETSYIENILRLNKGKLGTFYFTYTDSIEWRDRVFKGIIEAAGRDHLIISDPKTGKRHLFLLIYLNWVEFDEEIEYEYPFR